MKKYNMLQKMARRQGGEILIYVLIFIAIAGLILPPFISYITTDYKSGQLFEQKADDYYSADAGVQDAQWQISNENLSVIFPISSAYDQFNFSTTPPWHGAGRSASEYGVYAPSEVGNYDNLHQAEVNSNNVTVSIKNLWVVSNVSAPDTTNEITQARNIIQTAKLVVSGRDAQGTVTVARKFQLDINFFPSAGR